MIALIILSGLVITGNFVCFHVCRRQEKKIRRLTERYNEERRENSKRYIFIEKEIRLQKDRIDNVISTHTARINGVTQDIKSLDSTVNVLRQDMKDYKEVMEIRYKRERRQHLERHTLLSGDVFSIDCRLSKIENK